MTKKIAICIALAGLFIGLAVGINIGSNSPSLPIIVNVACLAVGVLFGFLAERFHKKSTTK